MRAAKVLYKPVALGALILRDTNFALSPAQAYELLKSGRVRVRQGGKEWVADTDTELRGRFDICLTSTNPESRETWRTVDV
mgnify:CR=1 FL=1